jgi:NADH dehydrogenase FAD-containing subunit
MGCAVNPAVGYEQTLDESLIVPTNRPGRVVVVGGGPGGMEAAQGHLAARYLFANSNPAKGGELARTGS